MSETPGSAAARAGCVISVSHSRVPRGSRSGSGVLLGRDPAGAVGAVVLCPGILFSPFLLESERPDWSRGKALLSDRFFPGLQIQVLQAAGCNSSSSQAARATCLAGDLGANHDPGLRFNPLSSRPRPPPGWRSRGAELLMVAACKPFQEAFSKIFGASDGWRFEGNDFEQEAADPSESDGWRALHWFALLRILEPGNPLGASWLSCVPAGSLKKGDPVLACGSPFGSLCPEIFMNTLSKGIVSNLAGAGNALLLTDARCLPGTEGGGVFVLSGRGPHLRTQNNRVGRDLGGHLVQPPAQAGESSLYLGSNSQPSDCEARAPPLGQLEGLVGIIVAPLCWKSTEWVGLTLVCAVDAILGSVARVLSRPRGSLEPPLLPTRLVTESPAAVVLRSGLDGHLLDAVVLVECGPTWGSGVMVNSRLLLTCRHVVGGASNVHIRFLTRPNRDSVVKGNVVFATKDSSPYDIALVELEEGLSTLPDLPLASTFHPGEDVSIVSFGVFGQACGPSVTSGILSAVITVEDKPVMLQATSAVHGGSSGGALFGTHSGKLLGIVASNTRDNSVGVTYPHLNFSIPVTILRSAILEYIHHRSLHGFQELDGVGERIQVVWRLQREPVEMPLSKL